VSSGWTCQYEDARVILEQKGDFFNASSSEDVNQLNMRRDMCIRRYVDTSIGAVAQENVSMKSQLQSLGLTEKIVKSNPLLRGNVASDSGVYRHPITAQTHFSGKY
jgi:hypothetical protein